MDEEGGKQYLHACALVRKQSQRRLDRLRRQTDFAQRERGAGEWVR